MLKPSGGFFKRMFNPDVMAKAKKRMPGGMKKPMPNPPGRALGLRRPAPPRPVLHGGNGGVKTKTPSSAPRGGEVRTLPRGGPVNRTMPRAGFQAL